MTTLAFLKLLFDITLVIIGCLAIINEKKLARFERKVARSVKAFFKALVACLYERKQTKNGNSENVSSLPTYRNEEYDEILSSLRKTEQAEEFYAA